MDPASSNWYPRTSSSGPGHTPDEVVLLDAENPHPTSGHDRGGGQSVVSRSDDDCVIVRHRGHRSAGATPGGASTSPWVDHSSSREAETDAADRHRNDPGVATGPRSGWGRTRPSSGRPNIRRKPQGTAPVADGRLPGHREPVRRRSDARADQTTDWRDPASLIGGNQGRPGPDGRYHRRPDRSRTRRRSVPMA